MEYLAHNFPTPNHFVHLRSVVCVVLHFVFNVFAGDVAQNFRYLNEWCSQEWPTDVKTNGAWSHYGLTFGDKQVIDLSLTL